MKTRVGTGRVSTAEGSNHSGNGSGPQPQHRRKRKTKPNSAPVPNSFLSFTARLELIYKGEQRTKAEDLFEPMERFDTESEKLLGFITNRTTQELYSLSKKLWEEAQHLRKPRKPGEMKAYELRCAELAVQRHLAMDLFWQHVKSSYPDESSAGYGFGIREGWKVTVRIPPPSEEKEEVGVLSGIQNTDSTEVEACWLCRKPH